MRTVAEIEHELEVLRRDMHSNWCMTLVWPRLDYLRNELFIAKATQGEPGLVGFRVEAGKCRP